MPDIPVAKPTPKRRYRLSRSPLLAGAGLAAVALLVVMVGSFVWPGGSDVDAPSPLIDAGEVGDFVVGEPIYFANGKFFVVRLESREIIAISALSTHAVTRDREECLTAWRSDFDFQGRLGWFRNPCTNSTHTVDGTLVFGPSPRSMDRFAVETRDGIVRVDTGVTYCGPPLPTNQVCGP